MTFSFNLNPIRKLHHFSRIHGNPLGNFFGLKTLGTSKGTLGHDPWHVFNLKNSLKVLFFKRCPSPWEPWLDSPAECESEDNSLVQRESSQFSLHTWIRKGFLYFMGIKGKKNMDGGFRCLIFKGVKPKEDINLFSVWN